MKSGIVAIIGRPNAGKSTLLNRAIGSELSIVTSKAQTTRDRVRGILTETQGQVVFIDTPGIHRAREGGINQYMVSEAKQALDSPDLVWYLVDPTSALEHEKAVLELLSSCKAPVFLVFTKSDLKKDIKEFESSLQAVIDARVFHISARKDEKIAELLKETWNLLPEGPMYYPESEELSDRPLRFFVAEKIREQLFLQLADELPYCCAVKIDKFNESTRPIRIEATIFAERDSQKGMIIGAGGKKIKSIGQHARKSIEDLIGEQIFLGLKVDILKDWSKDSNALRKMGYDLPRSSS